MKEIVASLTRRGQITVPVEVRRLLGAEAPGKLVFKIDGEEVRLERQTHTWRSAFGAVQPVNRPEDFKEIERQAKAEHIDRFMEKLREQ